jgi:hypothetical protein
MVTGVSDHVWEISEIVDLIYGKSQNDSLPWIQGTCNRR